MSTATHRFRRVEDPSKSSEGKVVNRFSSMYLVDDTIWLSQRAYRYSQGNKTAVFTVDGIYLVTPK